MQLCDSSGCRSHAELHLLEPGVSETNVRVEEEQLRGGEVEIGGAGGSRGRDKVSARCCSGCIDATPLEQLQQLIT